MTTTVTASPCPAWEQVREVFDRVAELTPPAREAALAADGAAGVDGAVLAEVRALLAQLEAQESEDSEALGEAGVAGEASKAGAARRAEEARLAEGNDVTYGVNRANGANGIKETNGTKGSGPANGARSPRRSGFLERPALPEIEALEEDLAGTRVGPWRLVRLLGRGGMGEVWEARRDDGAYDATVAVKVLRGTADDDHLRSHFAQEQRLLARLNHAHIARLMDAGHLADGRPYFVMEAVQGRPLDEAAAGLPLAQRLDLFLQLTDAVAHAHRQGLVHRDLKPSNVLVNPEGQVKLLDFGIAHALDRAPTVPGAPRPLTPGYASPEQVRGEVVGAPSDVYSLGVLLHVLLTGSRPYGRGATTVAEALRAVLQEPPTAPSLAPPSGGVDAGVERRRLAGDLDAIVLKALAKAVPDRYPTVQALADDLRAHLQIRPVAARPRSALYVSGRFARRHRGAVAAAGLALMVLAAAVGLTAWQARDAVIALAVLSLAAGVGVSGWQARQARAARDEARARLAETSGLVRDVVMRYADVVTFLPGGLRMKADLLHDTLAHLERLAAGVRTEPELAGEMAKAHARMADILVEGVAGSMARPDEAQRHLEAAQALFPLGEPVHRDDPGFWLWWSRSMRGRALLARGQGDAAQALAWRQRQRDFTREGLRRFPGNADLRHELGSALFGIGSAQGAGHVATSLDDPAAAEAAFAEADALFQALSDAQPQDVTLLHQLGVVAGGRMLLLARLGRLDEAVAQGRRDLAFKERVLALEPLNVAYRESLAGEAHNVTIVLLDAGRFEEAESVSARGEAVITALEAEDPQVSAWTERRRWFAWSRGRALLAAGRPAEALPRLLEAMQAMAGASAGRTLVRRAVGGLALAQALEAAGDAPASQRAALTAQDDLQAAMAAGLREEPQVRELARPLAQWLAQRGLGSSGDGA